MLTPKHLLPSALGLAWGLPLELCLSRIQMKPSAIDNNTITVPLSSQGHLYQVDLLFATPGQEDLYYWYDGMGNKYDLVHGTMWNRAGNLILETDERSITGLFRIQTPLFESQLFFEEDLGDEDLYDVLRRISVEYMSKYEVLITEYSAILGSPAFSGPRYIEDEVGEERELIYNTTYPTGQWEHFLTYWNHPEGRLQLGLRQEDKELPFIITLACYRNK